MLAYYDSIGEKTEKKYQGYVAFNILERFAISIILLTIHIHPQLLALLFSVRTNVDDLYGPPEPSR